MDQLLNLQQHHKEIEVIMLEILLTNPRSKSYKNPLPFKIILHGNLYQHPTHSCSMSSAPCVSVNISMHCQNISHFNISKI